MIRSIPYQPLLLSVLLSGAVFPLPRVQASTSASEPLENLGMEPPRRDEPVTVTASLFILDITRINEIDNVYTVEVDIEESWDDPRLGFPVAGTDLEERIYVGLEAERQAERMWSANLGATNVVGMPSVRKRELRIRSDGRVAHRARINGSLKTPLDFQAFPFDRQELVIEIESFTWDAETVRLASNPTLTRVNSTLEMPEWTVGEVKSLVSEGTTERQTPVSRLTVTIDVRRRAGFYLWKVMLPIITIVFISWVVFWMGEESLARRAGVSATAILTVIAYQFIVSASLPRVAYLTVMDRLILFSFVTIALTMLVNLAVSLQAVRERGVGPRIDFLCRFLFPAIYLLGLAVMAGRNVLGS